MAKKGGRHQSKSPAEKKETTKLHKLTHTEYYAKLTKENIPINEFIKANISTKTSLLRDKVCEKFNISANRANARIKYVRIKEGVYNKSPEAAKNNSIAKTKLMNKNKKSKETKLSDFM